jgi:hypothetical protein
MKTRRQNKGYTLNIHANDWPESDPCLVFFPRILDRFSPYSYCNNKDAYPEGARDFTLGESVWCDCYTTFYSCNLPIFAIS